MTPQQSSQDLHSLDIDETTKLTQELAVKLEQGEAFVSGTQWQTEK